MRAARRPLALLHSCGAGPVALFDRACAVCEVPPTDPSVALCRLHDFLQVHRELACVGYLAYDLRDAVEPVPRHIRDDFPVPLIYVVAFERVRTWGPMPVPAPPQVPPAEALRAHLTRADYEGRVVAIIEHIRAGDIFQANLTQPFTGSFRGDTRALFWRLCHESPAPFAAYVETDDGLSILSSSPEEFLRVEDGVARTRPIKGTRPRGVTPEHDAFLLQQLLSSEKDQAELAMIVDLMRNDLGKVARAGAVEVGPFPEHDSFADVHHMFATVTARLRPHVSLVDVLRATFPPGSITGAPKLRCMELLEELEVVRRGVYTGAIGRFGPGERMHLSVTIRTMTLIGERLRCNTGGGITADSHPQAEFEETMHKAAGMARALQREIELP